MTPTALLVLLPALPLAAQGFGGQPLPPPPDEGQELREAPNPSIRTLEDGRLQLGDITFDRKTRGIRFPAEVNMTEGLLEFLVVHRDGKIHESLLLTDISPLDLNIVFKLLGYEASPELYYETDDQGRLTGTLRKASPEQQAKSRLSISALWQDEGRERRTPLHEWVTHAVTEAPMPGEPWVYGGSFISDGRFVAELSGDLVAIYLSNSALVNYSGKDKESDEVWLPHPTRVPAVGTPVTVIIEPRNTEP